MRYITPSFHGGGTAQLSYKNKIDGKSSCENYPSEKHVFQVEKKCKTEGNGRASEALDLKVLFWSSVPFAGITSTNVFCKGYLAAASERDRK